MTALTHNRFLVPAWAVSLTLHGVVVTLAMLFAAQVRPVLQDEPFKWDVALVETAKTESPTEPTAQPAADAMPPVVRPVQTRPSPSPVEPPPDTVTHRVAPQQTVQMVHPEAPPQKPIEQRQEPPLPLKAEPLTPPVTPAPEKTIEPVEQQVAEIPKTKPEPVMPTKEPVPSSEPVMAQHKPVAPSTPDPVEPRYVEAPAPSAPLASSSHAEPAPAAPSPAAPAMHEAPVQTAKANPGPVASEVPVPPSSSAARSDVKADHRWLAESLGRRLAELKRYPNEARVSRLQGKVILKAVIRSDGHLADVSVHKSSGHSILDEAAMEAVRSACPLHMQHDIGRPIIVVQVPIVYSLNN